MGLTSAQLLHESVRKRTRPLPLGDDRSIIRSLG